MLNLDAAKSSAMSVAQLQGSNITDLTKVVSKASTATQVIGEYDQIYPYLHENYPTRDEIDKLMKDSFESHHNGNFHLPIAAVTPGTGSPIGMAGTTVLTPVQLIPKEKVVGQIRVRSGSPVNSIGYGV